VYEYDSRHEQHLVYVTLSRVTSLNGLFITNTKHDFTFFHARSKENKDLHSEFSVQSHNVHQLDVTTDFVLPKCKIMALSETWIENDQLCEVLGYRTISRFKRNIVRSKDVAIFEKEKCSSLQWSAKHDLLKNDRKIF